MKLKDLCLDERPREKLLQKGTESLSNTELIAILLRTGTGGRNVVDVARELLKSAGEKLNGIMCMPIKQICKIEGIGPSKAAALAAAFELGKRCASEPIVDRRECVSSPKDVYMIMTPRLRGLEHEECWGLYLNRANYVIGKERFSSGGLDSTIMDVKVIARKALEQKASSLILVHNHPSSNAMPGTADINATKTLKKALDICGIALTDHVILAEDSYYSFADELLQKI